MKKSTKKLMLKRETVNALSNEALAEVNGGTSFPILVNPIDKYAYGRGGTLWACSVPGTFDTCGWLCQPY